MVLLRSTLSGAKVASIVKVLPIRNVAEAQFRTLLIHDREQLVLAVEAAGRIVARILRSRHLISDDNIERNLPALGEFDRELQLMPRQAWRVGEHRQHVLAE